MRQIVQNGLFGFAACLIGTGEVVAEPGREGPASLLPENWDPVIAGDQVMDRLVTVTAPQVKGAHDAEFALVGRHAYIVAEVDDEMAGESAARPHIYSTLSIVALETLEVEEIQVLARGKQVFENTTLPEGAIFVPRIHSIDGSTLRCYFASERPGQRQSVTWYRDFDLATREFAPTIHRVRLKTADGTFDMEPRYFHADAVAAGFAKPPVGYGLYLFDSFKTFDGETYVAINNFPGKQNALARVHDDFATFEILGHYNEPQTERLSESSVNRLPDGTWMAICRNDAGNYHFTTSDDGREWTVGREMPHVANGGNSKPTFDRIGDLYYLGWQERTRIEGVHRSVFNLDVSRDGKHWERKYRFETTNSFQYPTFRAHEGEVWLTVTQGDSSPSRKERILFGRLERTGAFESQEGLTRKPRSAPEGRTAGLVTFEPGALLFTDRDYRLSELPELLANHSFLRTTIDNFGARVEGSGTLYALTPPETIDGAASQEESLRDLGFEKADIPVFQLFPGRINQVCVYRKSVEPGETFAFRKVVLLVAGEGVNLRPEEP